MLWPFGPLVHVHLYNMIHNTISLLTYPKLGFSKLIYNHQKKPNNYNTLKQQLQVIKLN